MAGGELTDRQKRFVEEYLLDTNATQSAIRAGYSVKTAEDIGRQLLRKTPVATAIQAAMDERAAEKKLDAAYVLDGLMELAERCMQRAPVMVGTGKDRHQLIDEDGNHVWQFDSAGASRAFDLLGKHLKLFTEVRETTNNINLDVTMMTEQEKRNILADAMREALAKLPKPVAGKVIEHGPD